MATNLNYTAEQINRILYLVDETKKKNKNLLTYPYNAEVFSGDFSDYLEDVGDGSILITKEPNMQIDILLQEVLLSRDKKYVVRLTTTGILEDNVKDTSNCKLIIKYNEGNEDRTVVSTTGEAELDLSDLSGQPVILVYLSIPAEVDKGLLVKPQIEEYDNSTGVWVPNMDNIGTYIDGRYDSLNTKFKVLTKRFVNYYNTPTIAIKCSEVNSEVDSEKRFKADIVVSNNPGIAGYQYTLKFNNGEIQFIGVEKDNDNKIASAFPVSPTLNIKAPGETDYSEVNQIQVSCAGTTASTKNGTYLTIYFKLLKNIENSKLTLTNICLSTQYGQKIECENISGFIYTKSDSNNSSPVIYGDIDGDGEVSIADAVLLAQYLAKWDVVINEQAADCDGDGEVTIADAVLLSQYLAGWNVKLGPQTQSNSTESN